MKEEDLTERRRHILECLKIDLRGDDTPQDSRSTHPPPHLCRRVIKLCEKRLRRKT
jgi:hypothetical protein